MVFVNEGDVLSWREISANLEKIKSKIIQELVSVYNKFKNIQGDPFKWGDEIELTLIKFDHINKKCSLLLKSEEFFIYFNKLKQETCCESDFKQFDYHNEYTKYIIEAIPAKPIDDDINSFSKIEQNMKLRKKFIQDFLGDNEYVVSLTSFPRLGCMDFTIPIINQEITYGKYNSIFYPNDIIMNRKLFLSATFNKIDRTGSKPVIYVPIFPDTKTMRPFVEELPNRIHSKPDYIYLDHDGFAMGCCCIQVTFQASSCKEACYLYDQLTPIAPIITALSASSPIWRGYLSNIDCRWNVLKQAFDDRTDEELGFSPLRNQRYLLKKSRFDCTDVYLSREGSNFNDFDYDRDDSVYKTLIDKGMDESLAQHFASMFTRDPFIVFDDDLKTENENFSGNFDIFNCTNWRLLRFKPPPMNSLSTNQIGWRVEFRPTEIQFTDFENSAFCIFVILLTRAIVTLNLNFLIGITLVSDNMERAQTCNACMIKKFHFRQNVNESETDAKLAELSINEIINGNSSFKGLIYYIYEYLKKTQMTDETKAKIDNYLKLIRLRASGDLLTPASWIRNFVLNHSKYKKDSKVSEEINYDLMWNIYQISNDLIKCNELLP